MATQNSYADVSNDELVLEELMEVGARINDLSPTEKCNALTKERLCAIVRNMNVKGYARLRKADIVTYFVNKWEIYQDIVTYALKEQLTNKQSAIQNKIDRAKFCHAMKTWGSSLRCGKGLEVVFHLDGPISQDLPEFKKPVVLEIYATGVVIGEYPLTVVIKTMQGSPVEIWNRLFSMSNIVMNFDYRIYDDVTNTFSRTPGYYYNSQLGWVARLIAPVDRYDDRPSFI